MSKISEQKALEAYPPENGTLYQRLGYVKGYDQAMQDVLEKAEEFFYEQFNIHPHDCHVVQYVSDTPLENMDDFIEQFKKHVQNEM